jgi:amino acid adenylation domain-containing protein
MMSYLAVEEAANLLSIRLQESSTFCKGTGIGIVGHHCIEQVIAMVAISKSACWFVPIDPELPQARIDTIVADASLGIIIESSKYETILSEVEGIKSASNFSSTDSVGWRIHTVSRSLSQPLKATNIMAAYCIFTSGTTGKPKGALVPQVGVTHIVSELAKAYYMSTDSRVLQFANLAFDGSLSEIFATFAAIGAVCIPGDETIKDLDSLSAYIISERISVAILPPSLVEHIDDQVISSLSTLVVAGEVCPVPVAQRLVSLVGHVINAYGPTEGSICATTFEVTEDEIGDTVPIGQSLPGVELSIHDAHGRVVAEGEVGELYIGGIGVFLGYLNDALRTDEVVKQIGLSDKKVYCTGDKVRMLANKNLVYLGRIDNQIKLHGIRLSPEEIEQAIIRRLKAETCVVVKSDDDRLVCFYAGKLTITVAKARRELRQILPGFAIPSNYIRLEQLPLTRNGKVDRQSLRQMILPGAALSNRWGESKKDAIKAIWSQTLKVSEIYSDSDFYNLGGDSLIAMILTSRINAGLGLNLAAVNILQHPIFHEFMTLIDHTNTTATMVRAESNQLTEYERLFWSSSELSSAPAAYTLTEVMVVTRKVQSRRLVSAARTLGLRHQALRTNFILENGVPVRHIRNKPTDDIYQTIRIDGGDEKEALASSIRRITNAPIDIAQAAVFVIYEVALADDSKVLIWHTHHIVTDAYGMQLLQNEFWKIYDANEMPFEHLDITPPALMVTAGSKSFWKSYLEDEIEITALPWDFPRPAIPTGIGSTLTDRISSDDSAAVRKQARIMGVTPFSLLYGAYMILLHRLTGQDKLLMGTAVSLRDILSEDSSIGPYLNTLPIIVERKNDDSASKFILRLRDNLLECSAHKDMPLYRILEMAASDGKLSLDLPFNVMFDYVAANSSVIDETNCTTQTQYSDTSKFDLTLTVVESSLGFDLAWEFDTALFNAATIRRISKYFNTVLGGILSDPTQPTSQLAVLSEKERDLITRGFNDNSNEIPLLTFTQLFGQLADKWGDRIAVTAAKSELTYRQLIERSDSIAERLIAANIKVGEPIGVYMHRSTDLVIAIIAIWKARAVYVPIEIDYPSDRIIQMVGQARIKTILCSEMTDTTALGDSLNVIRLDNSASRSSRRVRRNRDASTSDLAYVIFTSGSTGTPKGVMIEHLGMMNHIHGMINYFDLNLDTIIAQTASQCFDISVWQLVAPLLVGGTVLIYTKDEQLDPGGFILALSADKVTVVELVPSYLTVLLDYIAISNSKLGLLECMLVTGEAISSKLANRWQQECPSIPLINAYGPAETSDDTHLHAFQAGEVDGQLPVPVGKSLQNVRSYIVDRNMNPVPIGVKGEICIGGIAVGRGYINDPKTSAKVFGKDVFSDNASDRLYKTGDIGSWREDGTLYFHGRSDFQVKLRGFRIELEDIENQLLMNPLVTEAVVIVRTNSRLNKQLFAFYTGAIASDQLKAYVESKLPGYMIPHHIIRLNQLPKNNSGKIDRNNLPLPEELSQDPSDTGNSEALKALTKIWSENLGIANCSVNDNFFKLGGDSITCFQIVGQLASLGYRLTVRDIFSHPTISELALLLKSNTLAPDQIVYDKAFSLAPIQAHALRNVAAAKARNNQIIIIRTGSIDLVQLKSSLATIISKHPMLSARFNYLNGQYSQHITRPIESDSVIIERHASIEQTRSSFIESLSQLINVSTGPIFIAGLLRDDTGSEIYLVAHHLVCDIVSWSIIIEDLEKLYSAGIEGRKAVLMPEQTTYEHWANGIVDNSFDADRARWARILSNAQAFIPPPGITDVSGLTPKTTTIIQRLGNDSKAKLQSLTEISGNEATVFAIVIRALGSWGRGHVVAFMKEEHGRDDLVSSSDLSRTVGWFTACFPVVSKLKPTLREQVIQYADSTLPELNRHSYGVLRTSARPVLTGSEPIVTVNYLGQMKRSRHSSLFGDYNLTHQSTLDAAAQSPAAIEIDLYWQDTELFVEITYRSDGHTAQSLLELVGLMQNEIESCEQLPADNNNQPTVFNIDANRLADILDRLKIGHLISDNANDIVDDIYTLSPMQSGLLFGSLVDIEANLYIEQLDIMLKGALDVASFVKAWNEVISQYPPLRTVFDWSQGQSPIQIVLKKWEPTFIRQDYSYLSEHEAIARWHEDVAEDRRQSYRLDDRPPLRLYLARISQAKYRFLFSYHHILLDGGSITHLLESLASAYNALVLGHNRSIPSRVSYKEYINWADSQKRVDATSFWQQYLGGTTWPKSILATTKQAGVSNQVEERLPAPVAHAFRAQCQRVGLTPSVILQVLWAETLAKNTREPSVILGVPTSVKPMGDKFDKLVGVSFNTLPIKIELTNGATTTAIAQDLQKTWGAILENAQLSLGEIKRAIGYSEMSDPFSSLFTYSKRTSSDTPVLTGLDWSVVAHDESTQYALSTDAVLGDDYLILKLTYRQGQLTEDRAIVLLDNFRNNVLEYVQDEQRILKGIPSRSMGGETLSEVIAEGTKAESMPIDASLLTQIVAVWSNVLGRSVEPDSNFFALGGDSIASLQLVSKMLQANIPLTIKDVFDHPTPISQASALGLRAGKPTEDYITRPQNRSAAEQDLAASYHGAAEVVYGVSNVQLALLQRPASEQGLFHDQSTFTYIGTIEPLEFEQAWNKVISRNPSLRTIFKQRGSSWYQVVLKQLKVTLKYNDLSQAAGSKDQQIKLAIADDRAVAYDYGTGPLLRVALFKTKPNEYVFFLSFNVIIMDGWCFAFVLKEFTDEYVSLVTKSSSIIKQRPSYEGYIDWLTCQNHDDAERYWAGYLDKPTPNLLPTISQKLPGTIYDIESTERYLSHDIAESLTLVSARNGVTVNTTVQVAWSLVLGQILHTEDVLFGATVAGRPSDLPGYDLIVGLFFNDLPIHEHISVDEDIWVVARRLQIQFQESQRFGYLSTSQIKAIAKFNPEASLFQTLLVFENYPKLEELVLKSKQRTLLRNTAYWRRDMSDIDLTLYVEFSNEGIHLKANYLRGILKPELISELLRLLESEFIKVSQL